MAGSITSVNATYMLAISGLFDAPVALQQFSAEDIFTTGALAATETSMGLDGVLSGGFVNVPVVQNISLQANSPSNDLFEQWHEQQQQAQDVYIANAIVVLKAIGKKYAMSRGFLTSYPPIADAARTLRLRRYAITWNICSPSNV
jgi:hypothetical protein